MIDTDLRQPLVHQTFGINRTIAGLCDFLGSGAPLDELVVSTTIPNVMLLSTGHAGDASAPHHDSRPSS